jgi:putative multiple sugar transport system substrate-binding protein
MVLAFVAACDNGGGGSGTTTIGISLPTMSLQRWVQDGDNMKSQFEEAGFSVDLQYGGENDVPTQIAQIENMIAQKVDVLVICAIDGFALTEVLAQAKAADIPVIAYDRLIMNTDAVTYYATFDNFQVGVLQGTFLETALNLPAGGGPYNIEFFTGDPGDNNIHFFFGGAMSILQKYLDNGTLVCQSGQTDIMAVATVDWNPANAQARMENLIATYDYAPSGGTDLHAVMCSNDSTAQGVTTALQGAGFTADTFPLITGQDCDIVSVRNMIAGYQAMSVFKDTRTLAANVVAMVKAIVAGTDVPINDRETYDNGTGFIPTNLSVPVFADINNWRTLLIDSGYYTDADIG